MKINFTMAQKSMFDFNFLYKLKQYKSDYERKLIDFKKLEDFFQCTLPNAACNNKNNNSVLYFKNFLFQSVINTMIFEIFRERMKDYKTYDFNKSVELFDHYIIVNRKSRLINQLNIENLSMRELHKRGEIYMSKDHLHEINFIKENLKRIDNYKNYEDEIHSNWWIESETHKFFKN